MRSLLAALMFTGCASTTITSKNFTIRTQANIAVVDVKADGSFRIEGLNHSAATLAGGRAIGGGATAFGSALTGLATALIVR